jgi:DNA-binding protein Fis|tara:strand:+ start:1394 stop:1717 length:324 start_codon:yes stop_codon:yes gene_type:complete
MKKTNKYNSVLKDVNNKFENKNFELIISNLTLEELITLKLELSAKSLNGKLFGYPIYKNVQHIVRESLVRFALRFCNSQEKAANLLGINVREFKSYIKKHKLNINTE